MTKAPKASEMNESAGGRGGRGEDFRRRDFIRAIVAGDLEKGTHGGRVVTRFPPEPNGYLHIGHAKSIVLNFGIAADVPGAVCHLRFDDTNPETEEMKYVEAIQEDVRWLGYDWGEHLYFASDYFERMYGCAEHLIHEGKAYVDSQDEAAIRENRGTVAEPGRESPYRDRPADESLDLFRRMRAGEFPNGAHVLRAKIDMASPNMLLRDPVLYRIRHAKHYRTGDEWCIYPLYDWAHPLEDAFECVTHSLCTLEFESNRALYDWVVEHSPVECRPRQYEFARLNLDYTVMSKRKLLRLVREGHVDGWDDPRMPTIAGLRRRGVTPEAIRAFCEMIGVARTDSRVDIGKLEYAIRDDLNRSAPRVLCVLDPLRVVLTNWPEDETEQVDAPYFPPDVGGDGSRAVPFSRELFIERDDFMERPAPGFRRLAPGRSIRLRHAYVITCDDVVKDDAGGIVELRCRYHPEPEVAAGPSGDAAPAGQGGGPGATSAADAGGLGVDAPDSGADRASSGPGKVWGAIHWVSAGHSVPCEARLYDRLFRVPDPDAAAAESGKDLTAFLNPASLVVARGARIEPSVAGDPAGSRYQFERRGYFIIADAEESSAGRLVFNRTVTLRDTWAKQAAAARAAATATAEAPARLVGEGGKPGRPEREPSPDEQKRLRQAAAPDRSPELQARRRRYAAELGLSHEDAEILTREEATADFFDAALDADASARGVANWLINELRGEVGDRPLDELPFAGKDFGALVVRIEDGTLSSRAAREVLAAMVETGDSADAIVERRGLRRIGDEDALAPVVEQVIAEHPEEAARLRDGEDRLVGFFMGRIMRRTGGKADPELARRLLRERVAAADPVD